jgi:hypothetical protein
MTDMDHLEAQRLAALARYDLMDTPREAAFDEVAALAAKLCDVPIAVVNLIGDGRQFFKAEVGLGVRETPLDSSFCAKAILEQDSCLFPAPPRTHVSTAIRWSWASLTFGSTQGDDRSTLLMDSF